MTLHEWMQKKELKDEHVSRLLGGKLSRSQVSRIRRGKSIPTIETARLLEGVTKIPAAKFVLGEAAQRAA